MSEANINLGVINGERDGPTTPMETGNRGISFPLHSVLSRSRTKTTPLFIIQMEHTLLLLVPDRAVVDRYLLPNSTRLLS